MVWKLLSADDVHPTTCHEAQSEVKPSNLKRSPPQEMGHVQCDTPVLNRQLSEIISFVTHKLAIATWKRSFKSNDKVKFNKNVCEETEVCLH